MRLIKRMVSHVCSKTAHVAKQRELEGSHRPLVISATSVCIIFIYNGALPLTLYGPLRLMGR